MSLLICAISFPGFRSESVADAIDEEDLEFLPVDILIEIEDVDLDGERLAGERRIEADVEDPLWRFPLKGLDGVHAAQRDQLLVRPDVRRGEAEADAPAVP